MVGVQGFAPAPDRSALLLIFMSFLHALSFEILEVLPPFVDPIVLIMGT